jgi:hypothetical protein
LLGVLLGAGWLGDGPVPWFCVDGSFWFTAGLSPPLVCGVACPVVFG